MLVGAIDGVSDDEGQAAATLAAIRAFAAATPTIYLPAHDPDAARRLAERRTTRNDERSPAPGQGLLLGAGPSGTLNSQRPFVLAKLSR